MRRFVLPIIVAAAAAAGCGGDDESAQDVTTVPGGEVIPCVEFFDGRIFETTDELSTTCVDESGEATLNLAATLECTDGRVLWWNDVAWGYLGEPAMLHEEGAEQVAPQTERDGCGS